MSLTLNQQIFEFLKNSQRVLVVFRKNYSGDALASSLAIFLLLKKLDKKVDIVCENFKFPSNYAFLPAINQIQPGLACLKQFIISLDIKNNKVKELTSESKDDKLNIYLTPEKGYFDERSISYKSGAYKYDMIITLDTDDLESLGSIYEKNTDFFYDIPIINVDHNADNEQYGQINIVELTKTSTSEIIFDLVEEYDINLLDPEIATCLLTGMISKTKSFKSPTVTPRALSTASQLILNGAERDLIVQNLYRTKSISTLKLWGKILARLKHDPEAKLAWTYLQQKDLMELGLTNPDYNEVIEDLIASAPEAEKIILFHETTDKKIAAVLSTNKNFDALYLAKAFQPTGNKRIANFIIDKTDLVEAGREVIESIKANLK
jgi:nanoRNase/pAp phosphatase (c-di-AMP/oligoRNAs hydrolase)